MRTRHYALRFAHDLTGVVIAAAALAIAPFGCASDVEDDTIDGDADDLRRRCASAQCVPKERCRNCPPDGGNGDARTDAAPSAGDAGSIAPDASASADSAAPIDSGTVAPGTGIASKYPGDVGIASDPDVIFADDFESYSTANDLFAKWTNVYQTNRIRFDTTAANVRGGKKALEFTIPQGTSEVSNAVQKVLATKLDTVYFRYYSKFESNFDIVGSSHNGSFVSGGYFVGGAASPGVPANGTNKFLVAYESGRESASDPSPGFMNAYVYHPEQRDVWGDHFFPTGTVQPFTSQPFDFGSQFVSRPNVTPARDRYYAYEVMVKLNTVGQRDGRITFWMDGAVIADFTNLRFRDIATLKIDALDLAFHARSNPVATRKWYDNVVAAKRYIGPMAP